MTPKDKCDELFATYRFILSFPGAPLGDNKDEAAIRCALATVNEIIQAIDFDWMEIQNLDRIHTYWELVKEEINKL